MAAPSVVSICNRALQKLGASRITAIDESSKNARACNNCYESLRDALLRAHAWNFATTRASLAAESPAPTWGRANSFPLPSDCLKLLDPYPEDNLATRDHQIENGKILTNDADPLYIRYTAQITDPVVMDSLFREALATLMAVEMCEEITQSNTKKRELKDDYKSVVAEARRANAFENPAAMPPEDDWITARA